MRRVSYFQKAAPLVVPPPLLRLFLCLQAEEEAEAHLRPTAA
jgi:hypothetical protein